jgi:hypothetical protein
MVDEARRAGRRIRFLYRFGGEFEGFTPSGAWQDLKIGLHSMRLFEGCAIVSDIEWIRQSTRLIAFFMPCPVRVFGIEEQDKAVEWLGALPEGAGVSHRLVPASGVIVVEVAEPLRAEDFDAVALTADSWLETHADLNGIVIHARSFPGWKNFASFLRHVQFVRDHHRAINRVAIASDSALADFAPRLAEHFVEAELKSFGYDELEPAIAWAGGPAAAQAPPRAPAERATSAEPRP